MSDQPSTSRGIPEKGIDLEKAQDAFERENRTEQFVSKIVVRRRKRGLRHVAEDLLFVVSFEEAEMGPQPILNVLMGVHGSILALIKKLKRYFNEKQRRLCFFSAMVEEMTSPLFSGHRDLWKESERSICNSILKPLMAYFCSNSEIDLTSGLEIKCCVISLAHTLEYDQKRRPRKRPPPPENHLVGHRGSSLKSIENYSGNNFGLILIPNGTPKEPRLFADKCMPISFCIGRMIYQASYQGEATVKKLLFDLRGLSQRAKASKKHKNTIGRKIWEETQSMLDEICTPANGPHSYSVLDDLTRKFNCQAIVFSNLLAQPLYTFPSNSAQTRPDLPCVFLQEVVTLDPQAKTQWHLQTIIWPEYFFKKKFICELCFQVTSYGSTHAYCPVRKRCFLCSRIKLNESDWYGFLMSKNFALQI